MKLTPRLSLLAIAVSTMLSSCASPMYSGSMGQRSAQHNASNSDPRSMVSEQRLMNDRRRRTNVVEDARARRELREHDRDETLSPLKTIREGASLVRGIGFGF